jgi:hypothetical protein
MPGVPADRRVARRGRLASAGSPWVGRAARYGRPSSARRGPAGAHLLRRARTVGHSAAVIECLDESRGRRSAASRRHRRTASNWAPIRRRAPLGRSLRALVLKHTLCASHVSTAYVSISRAADPHRRARRPGHQRKRQVRAGGPGSGSGSGRAQCDVRIAGPRLGRNAAERFRVASPPGIRVGIGSDDSGRGWAVLLIADGADRGVGVLVVELVAEPVRDVDDLGGGFRILQTRDVAGGLGPAAFSRPPARLLGIRECGLA